MSQWRVKPVTLEELLVSDGSGLLRFAGARAVVMDATALGLLRKEVIEAVGVLAARELLTHFGFTHGWRTAQALSHHEVGESAQDWKLMGGMLHALQGHVSVELTPWDGTKGPEPQAHSTWFDSYEAEQHLLHVGQSEQPVCWTSTGFASGYLSYVKGESYYVLETQCVGCGDGSCKIEGRKLEEWGTSAQQEVLERYRRECPTGPVNLALHMGSHMSKEEEHQLQEEYTGGMVVRSDVMWEVLRLARRVAPTNTTVLLQGESGVGKEQVARLIHERSLRAEGPFVAVNCGAFQDSLLESELFGHAKGSFSGAHQAREGLFEAANGGTLFLDEIGELSALMQVKLLRALQERQIRRVGENHPRQVDVRVLAATHRDLAKEAHSGSFREDLLYRIKVFPIEIPPLRKRADDILELAQTFLDRQARELGRAFGGFQKEAVKSLLTYSWPGNVRELQNAVEYASILAEGTTIKLCHLPQPVQEQAPHKALIERQKKHKEASLEEVIQAHIEATLQRHQGKRKDAANQLGISEATLYRRLREYKEKRPPHEGHS